MWCRSLFASLVVLLLLWPSREARACGPDFPPELLTDRAGTLAQLPEGAFALEASRLLPKPADPFREAEFPEGADERGEPRGAREGGGARETALYAAGAKAYHAGDYTEARARFLDVLALPPEERRRFSTFAAYMLGRTAGAGLQHEARPRFAEVRELARQGFDDPLGLAVASLGEEALLLLEQGDDAGAIRLYAEQAAHGSTSGTTSLLLVARALRRDEARLREALKDPLAQRLMATYVWTRGREWLWSDEDGKGQVQRVLEALASVPGLAGADRLAAGAWSAGRFDLAERFAGQESTPLAAWVRAKVALRRGDRAAAERYLAQAAEGIPEAEDWTGESGLGLLRPRMRAEGERALLALSRGDFAHSAERVLASCSWPDIAYVAERVLTVEELQRLLASFPEERCGPELAQLWDDNAREGTNSVKARLRLLLGRRLLRDGAGARALEYFLGTRFEQPARQYVEARERADAAGDPVDRARALYEAARLARTVGMEVLGTEAAPDWAQVDGFYDKATEDYATPGELPPEAEETRKKLAELPLVTEAEQQRTKAHAPPHAVRFHYRSTAADLAEQAAELMPKRSQAYAVLLCHAARFTASTEPERGPRLWRTYVKNGALLGGKDDMRFGQECPEPDFERARAQQPTLASSWKGLRRRTLAALGGGVLAPVALGAVLLRRRKRKAA